MKELKERIQKEGVVIGNDILKVDSFINHQVDPVLMEQIGEVFCEHFSGKNITKIVTIESSGIAPALMTAKAMKLPLVILKKQPSKVLNENLFQTEVTSFTTGKSYELTLNQEYITEQDHVLIIDDFLADGEAATGAIRLLRKAHATIGGIGVLIDKHFQPGFEKLTSQGFDVFALAQISSMDENGVHFL